MIYQNKMKPSINPTQIGSRFRQTKQYEWTPLTGVRRAPLIPGTMLEEKCADELAESVCNFSDINSGATANEACLGGIVDALRKTFDQLESLELETFSQIPCSAQSLDLTNTGDVAALRNYCTGYEAFNSTCPLMLSSPLKNAGL